MQLHTKANHHQRPPTLKPHNWQVLWRMFRPHTLSAAFVPVTLGAALSLPYNNFRTDLFLAMLMASILIQAATNMFNEYFDFKRGLDHAGSVGISGSIVRDGLAPATVLNIALLVMAIALALGLYLCVQTSWILLPIGLACAAVGYLYSGGPYPISATPFGEIVAGTSMGVVIVGISFFLQTGTVTMDVLLVSVPTSVLIGAILMANNIRDLDDDKRHGRRTLAILLERHGATRCLAGMFAFSYGWIIWLIATGVVSTWALASFASIPKAIQATQGFSRYTSQQALMPAMIATAKANTIFGFCLTLGLVLAYWRMQ